MLKLSLLGATTVVMKKDMLVCCSSCNEEGYAEAKPACMCVYEAVYVYTFASQQPSKHDPQSYIYTYIHRYIHII